MDVLFDLGRVCDRPPHAGSHLQPGDSSGERAARRRSYERSWRALRHSEELAAERERLEADLDRPPDKTLALVGEMPGMAQRGEHGHGHHSQGHGEHAGTEAGPGMGWGVCMPMMNEMSTHRSMHWRLIDRGTGNANHDIRWSFRVGDRVKIRIVDKPARTTPCSTRSTPTGQRFLVLALDGVRNPNLAWKDTILVSTGQTTAILVEMSNPGLWMVHCHIAEHLEGGMMFSYLVEE